MYQHELARRGVALFKVRGHYLTGVVIIGTVIAYFSRATGPFASASANHAWYWVSLGVAVAGALVRIVTSGYAAPGTSGNPKDAAVAAELNSTGPYSLVRNPLYFGRILNFTGIAMLSGSWVYGVITFLVSLLVYERVSVYEEEFLRKEFGEAHAQWAVHVPFLWPRLHGWVKPKYPFWVRRCIMREDKKIFWLMNAVMLYDFAVHGFDIARLHESPILYYSWGGVALAYLIIRTMRRFGKTFDGIS